MSIDVFVKQKVELLHENLIVNNELLRILYQHSQSKDVFKFAEYIDDEKFRADTINEYVVLINNECSEIKNETKFMSRLGYVAGIVMILWQGCEAFGVEGVSSDDVSARLVATGAFLALGIYETAKYFTNECHRKCVERNIKELKENSEIGHLIETYKI